jgi:hypothetical protein
MSAERDAAAREYLHHLLDERVAELTGLERDYPARIALIESARRAVDPAHLAERRLHTAQRETAHVLAAETARRRVENALDDIRAMNFGAARETLRNLVENGLPNDHGGPVTHYPLFDEQLERQVEADRARET